MGVKGTKQRPTAGQREVGHALVQGPVLDAAGRLRVRDHGDVPLQRRHHHALHQAEEGGQEDLPRCQLDIYIPTLSRNRSQLMSNTY